MEGNSALDNLLIAYILKELNAEEEAFVVAYINADRKNKKYFEELRQTLNLVAANDAFGKVDIHEEWNRFEQSLARKQQKLVPVKKHEDPAGKIVGNERSEKSARLVKLLAYIAIAASVLLAIVWGWDFILSGKSFLPEVAKQEKDKTMSTPDFSRREVHQKNTTGKIKKFVLSDGSQVLLFDKSELSYKEPFNTSRRDVLLKGKADFKVAGNAAKPFTVFSMDLATTAIGTHFMVAAYVQSDNIKVRLYEGKIVIRPANPVSRTLKSDYYLSPGQELVYNNRNYTAKLIHFNRNTNIKHNSNESFLYDNPSVPENSKGSWYMFNNQSLAQIFDQLKLMYNVDIIYSKSDVRKLYFIGKFDKSESLSNILSQIAFLNNFKVTKKNEKFIISK